MAKTLTSYDFSKPHPGRPCKYPWHLWTDGQVWVLQQGEDFTVAINIMQTQVSAIARNRGLGYKTHREGDKLIVQFTKTKK